MTELHKHWWVPIAAAVVALYALAAQMGHPRGYAIAAFGNVAQSALLLLLLVVMLLNAITTQGRVRWFWGMMSLGSGLWLTATLMWMWFEVIARRNVPEPFVGDVLFFIHLVPLMAALALRPHRTQARKRLEFGGLDFLLLLLWWIYLYLFVVIPWQYIYPDRGQYGFSFNLLYAIENGILVIALIGACRRTRTAWRALYGIFLSAAAVYAIAAQLANQAISRDLYYSGSLFDLPLVLAMALFVLLGVHAYGRTPDSVAEPTARTTGLIASRLAMLAVISLPLLGVWAHYTDTPYAVKAFRQAVTAGALVLLPGLIFLKQYLLDRELVRLWRESEHNYENLKRLQAQLVQAEKLASLTQLVSGAAHEINNPLTAIMGYSDLLADDPSLPEEKRGFVTRIGQQARRVREVVANLRAFAKQMPGEKRLLDVNLLLADATELRTIDLAGDGIRIEQALAKKLPRIMGDENRLLQAWFHIVGNGIDALRQKGGGTLRVSSRAEGDKVVIEFEDDGPGVKDIKRIFDPFYTTKPVGQGTGLGLSACYGIVNDHQGQIYCENRPSGGAKFTVQLPVADAEEQAMAARA